MQTAIVILDFSPELLQQLPEEVRVDVSTSSEEDKAILIFSDEHYAMDLRDQTVEILDGLGIEYVYFQDVSIVAL